MIKTAFTRYLTNFRPVKNSHGLVLRSEVTKLTMRKFIRLAAQKFDRVFGQCG